MSGIVIFKEIVIMKEGIKIMTFFIPIKTDKYETSFYLKYMSYFQLDPRLPITFDLIEKRYKEINRNMDKNLIKKDLHSKYVNAYRWFKLASKDLKIYAAKVDKEENDNRYSINANSISVDFNPLIIPGSINPIIIKPLSKTAKVMNMIVAFFSLTVFILLTIFLLVQLF